MGEAEASPVLCTSPLLMSESLFDLVPNEILRQILVFLPIADYTKAGQVCKLWYNIINEMMSWGLLCMNWWQSRYSHHKVWGLMNLRDCLPSNCDYKWLAKCFTRQDVKLGLGFNENTKQGNIAFGEFKDGELNGLGVFIYSNDGYYVGEWKEGCRNGEGKYTWAKDTIYVGGWKNGYRNGEGKCWWPTGFTFSSSFVNGLPSDRENCFHPDIKKCLKEQTCTGTVTKTSKKYGQILYECSCGKCYCLNCAHNCHTTDSNHHLHETWVHCLDYCACCSAPEKCKFWKKY